MKNAKLLKRERRKSRIKGKLDNSKPRLVVFRSLNNNYAQIIDDIKRVTIASASDLKVKKGNKTERAKTVGTELAKAALAKNVTEVVFDRNGYKYHGRIKALADAAREAGLKF